MAEFKSIPVSQLLVDTENPRLDKTQPSQLETIRTLVNSQKSKVLALAKDILEYRLNPADSMIVTPVEGDESRYLVLEGNRRLCALKLLENPENILDLFAPSSRKPIKEMSSAFQANPITDVVCAVVEDRDDAYHWIELRHGGEQEGSGIVRWGAAESARFRQRFGEKEIHFQVLDYLEEKGELSAVDRKGVPVSSLKRIVEARHTRDVLGYEIEDGLLVVKGDVHKLAAVIKRITADLSSGKVRTKDIYLRDDRKQYVDSILTDVEQQSLSQPSFSENSPQDILFNMNANPSSSVIQIPSGTTTANATTAASSSANRRHIPQEKDRHTLVPQKTKLVVRQSRINDIYYELRSLSLAEYPNAVAVLFRVFLELTVDEYIVQNQSEFSMKPENFKYHLNSKLNDVASHLEKNGKITGQQAKAIKRISERDHFMAASINMFNLYVHNQYSKPSTSDLITAWDSLHSFFTAIWQ
jgi:hypothetical protein